MFIARGPGASFPGLILAASAALVAVLLGRAVPALSPLLVAILLGAGFAGSAGGRMQVGGRWETELRPGLDLSSRQLLRVGIILLGLNLALGDVVALGGGVAIGVVAVVGVGIVITLLVGRWLRMSATQSLLIACGFSICGAAAVAAVDGVLGGRKREEAAVAISLVVIFGTLMIGVVPVLAPVIGLSPQAAGVWAGASIHEVAQVVAAGGIIGDGALKIAIVVKLARVLLLAPVLALVAWQVARRQPRSEGVRRPPLVPLFVVGFAGMVVARTLNVVPEAVLAAAGVIQTALLSAAMFALGCSVRVSALRQAGIRPIALAAVATLVVAALGWVVAVAAGLT